MSLEIERRRDKTIVDFGEQWTHFTTNEGYYGSLSAFRDIVEPTVSIADFAGARVAEIGSGTGRIVRSIHEAGAAEIVALEPSKAMAVLRENTADIANRSGICRSAATSWLRPRTSTGWCLSASSITFQIQRRSWRPPFER